MVMVRFLKKKTGEKVLQYLKYKENDHWVDVPTVEEEVDQGYCIITDGNSYIMEIRKGLGKAEHYSMTDNVELAKRFDTNLDARIYMEQNELSLFDYDIRDMI